MNIHDWGHPQAAKLLLQYSENSSSAPMRHHAERGLAESVLFSGFLTFAFGLLLLPLTTTSLLGYPLQGPLCYPHGLPCLGVTQEFQPLRIAQQTSEFAFVHSF